MLKPEKPRGYQQRKPICAKEIGHVNKNQGYNRQFTNSSAASRSIASLSPAPSLFPQIHNIQFNSKTLKTKN